MRLYITGCPGSGKSTLARKLSRITGVPCVHLDEVMYEPDPANPGDNRKRDPEERDRMFREIIARPDWIIEDAGRKCFASAMDAADRVVILSPPRPVLYLRATKRWIKQNLGLEKCIYRPTIHMLGMMYKWISEYDASQFDQWRKKSVTFRHA